MYNWHKQNQIFVFFFITIDSECLEWIEKKLINVRVTYMYINMYSIQHMTECVCQGGNWYFWIHFIYSSHINCMYNNSYFPPSLRITVTHITKQLNPFLRWGIVTRKRKKTAKYDIKEKEKFGPQIQRKRKTEEYSSTSRIISRFP